MKKLFLWVMVVLGWGGMISCLSPQKTSDWKLVWEDDFEGSGFDTLTWSKIPRWTPEWARHMSDNEVCYEVKNRKVKHCLSLWGRLCHKEKTIKNLLYRK